MTKRFYIKRDDKVSKKCVFYTKYNEKDTFTPIFNSEKGVLGYGCLTESTSGGLSDTF